MDFYKIHLGCHVGVLGALGHCWMDETQLD